MMLQKRQHHPLVMLLLQRLARRTRMMLHQRDPAGVPTSIGVPGELAVAGQWRVAVSGCVIYNSDDRIEASVALVDVIMRVHCNCQAISLSPHR